MSGPPPKPTRLKKLAGNPGKRKLNEREPEPPVPSTLPAPPDFLNKEGKREWMRAGRILLDAKVLTEADLAALAAYSALYSRLAEAERNLVKEGPIVKVNGYPTLNTWLTVAKQCLKQMRAYMAELGLTPSSRTRIAAEPELLSSDERQKAEKYFTVIQ